MSRSLLFSVFLYIISGCLSVVYSQEVIYSKMQKFNLKDGDFSVVGKSGRHTFAYVATDEGYYLNTYDDSMNHVATVILDFFPKKIYETKFIAYPEQIVILYQSIESGKVVQHAALLDAMGKLIKRPITIATAKTGLFGPTKDYFSSAVSDDKGKILIYSLTENDTRLDFSGTWLDKEINIIGKGRASYKADNRASTGDGLLANDGTYYFPLLTPLGAQEFSDQYWMLHIAEGGNSISGAELFLNERFVTTAYMKMDYINNRIYIGGFFSDKKNGNYDGVLFGEYDVAAGKFQNKKLISFDDYLRNVSGSRNSKRAFNNFVVRNMIVKKDGGFVLIAENFYMTQRNVGYTPGWGYYSMYYTGGPYMAPSIREYHYDDVMALSYDGQGNKEWSSFIRKDQYSQEDGGIFSSFALINTGGNLGFLYNDYNTNHSRIQLATVDGEGKTNLRSMAAGNNDDPDWLPRSGKQVGSREIIIPCLKKKQIGFAKVLF